MVKTRGWTVAVLSACLLAAGCASGGGPAHGSDGPGGAPRAPSSNVGTQLDTALPASVRDLPLVDAAGRPRPLTSFRGQVLVISDMMTLCQETCPLDTASVVQTARAVEKAGLGDHVQFLSITIDPTRDTPAQIAAYRTLFTPVPSDWTTLTGPPAAVHALWKALGVYIEKVPQSSPPPRNWRTGKVLTYDLDHSDEVFFLDPDFHERFVLEGVPHVSRTAAVPAVLKRFMDAQGRQNLDHPPSTAWTVPQAERVLGWLLGERF